ncbi:MAG: hypothetical protein JSU94_09780 [Phycisphaerales bacterium]|nr:MAG: hypothetical protein JSU94_09780 [Phycisphaerales bacterium]
MNGKMGARPSIAVRLREFLATEAIGIEMVVDRSCGLNVVPCTDRRECDLNTLYPGGWITCETARAAARNLGISFSQMGKLLDHLNIKVRRCSLGCFQ